MYLHRYPAGEMSSCLGEGGVYSPASDDLVTRIGCSHWGFYDYIFVIYEKLQRRYTKKKVIDRIRVSDRIASS